MRRERMRCGRFNRNFDMRRGVSRCGNGVRGRLSRMHQRIQNFTQQAAPAKNPRFHGADRDFQDFGDFFVRQTFEIAEDHSAAEYRRHLIERLTNAGLHLRGFKLFKRRRVGSGKIQSRAATFLFHVNRNLLAVMTPAPTAMIERLSHRYSVEPGFQRAALPESANPLEGVKENFLRDVGSIGRVRKDAVGEVVHSRVVVGDQPVEGGVRPGLQLGYELGFVASPRQGLCEVGHAGGRISLKARP